MANAHMIWDGPAIYDHPSPCIFCKGSIKQGMHFGILGFDGWDRRKYVCHVSCFDAIATEEEGPPSKPVKALAHKNKEEESDWK